MEMCLVYFILRCFFSLKSQHRCVCKTPHAARLCLSCLLVASTGWLKLSLLCNSPRSFSRGESPVWREQWRAVGCMLEAAFLKAGAVAKSGQMGSLLETSEKSSVSTALRSWCWVRSWGGVTPALIRFLKK